ncbi:MAG: ABC transporter ATP-binding protein [Armatimonadetes bacterium]|nr:MAG: ABC transporter ATP-binding protein [Armatimonadota bacterium]
MAELAAAVPLPRHLRDSVDIEPRPGRVHCSNHCSLPRHHERHPPPSPNLVLPVTDSLHRKPVRRSTELGRQSVLTQSNGSLAICVPLRVAWLSLHSGRSSPISLVGVRDCRCCNRHVRQVRGQDGEVSVSDPAISIQNVTVRFRPLVDKNPTLRRSIGHLRHREKDEIVALDDVSLTIVKGEAFGVIGSNGAGKSTLLKVIAKTLKPTSGTVNVYGKTSTLLSLGLGMKPELSGRRNVYLGGLAAGLRKAEIDEKFDSIVEYADIGAAINRPVKTYSSGMFSRLAFSVAMAIEPNILLLDEVLAVGDESFRQKSLDTMKGLLENAGTIVFVSHALVNVVDFCDRTMWLDQGRIRMIGPSDEVVETYKAEVTLQK